MPVMVRRPSTVWRDRVAEEAAELDAGLLTPEQASARHLWPETLITGTDRVLADFDLALTTLDVTSDQAVMAEVQRVVEALNEVDEEQTEMGYETDEREMLCAYIEAALESAGVDLDGLTGRTGIPRSEITDEWRDW
jgi:hypothetical protein